MIRRILEAQERAAGRTTIEGVDLEGRRIWSSSGHDVLAATGAWQAELAERGVGPGDRVGLEVGRGPQLLPAHLAVLASGATVVPINPALAASERARMIERGDLRALVTDTDPRRSAARLRLEPSDPTRPALLIFTSGTTGDPKGVPLTEANLEANLADLATIWGLGPADRLLHALPCHHLHGLVIALYGAARLGLRILLMERFDAVRCLAELGRGSATVFMGSTCSNSSPPWVRTA